MIRDGIKSVARTGSAPRRVAVRHREVRRQAARRRPIKDAVKHRAIQLSAARRRHCTSSRAAWRPATRSSSASRSTRASRARRSPNRASCRCRAERKALGGHAVLAVGYDDSDTALPRPQLLGTGWGMGGYFTMPYAYLTDSNLADDFWTVRLIAHSPRSTARRRGAAAPSGLRRPAGLPPAGWRRS